MNDICTCANCSTRVVPMSNGNCPSCGKDPTKTNDNQPPDKKEVVYIRKKENGSGISKSGIFLTATGIGLGVYYYSMIGNSSNPNYSILAWPIIFSVIGLILIIKHKSDD